MSAIMSQNGRKMAQMLHSAAKKIDWVRFPCPVSTLNDALLCSIHKKVPKLSIVARTQDKPWFDDRCVLAFCAKQMEY